MEPTFLGTKSLGVPYALCTAMPSTFLCMFAVIMYVCHHLYPGRTDEGPEILAGSLEALYGLRFIIGLIFVEGSGGSPAYCWLWARTTLLVIRGADALRVVICARALLGMPRTPSLILAQHSFVAAWAVLSATMTHEDLLGVDAKHICLSNEHSRLSVWQVHTQPLLVVSLASLCVLLGSLLKRDGKDGKDGDGTIDRREARDDAVNRLRATMYLGTSLMAAAAYALHSRTLQRDANDRSWLSCVCLASFLYRGSALLPWYLRQDWSIILDDLAGVSSDAMLRPQQRQGSATLLDTNTYTGQRPSCRPVLTMLLLLGGFHIALDWLFEMS